MASNKLKQQYITELIDWYLDQPLSSTNVSNTALSREEAYIDLAVISSASVDREWTNSDRQTLMEQKYLEFQTIDIKDIWTYKDQMVAVMGVAGVGKSSLLQMYNLKWAKDEIYNRLENNIDFMFTFNCREINTLPNPHTLEDLLKAKYPKVFESITQYRISIVLLTVS